MSLEQAIHERRRNFWESIQAKAVPDSGIDLRRQIASVKGVHKYERPKIVIDGILLNKAEVVEYKRREVQRKLDELNAIAAATAAMQRAKDEEFRKAYEASHVRAYRLEEVKEAVCKHFDISMAEMVCERRTKKIVLKRQLAMYLCKELSHRSLPEIGRRFGGRDHTTVLHAIRKINRLLDQGDESILRHISSIKTALERSREVRQMECATL